MGDMSEVEGSNEAQAGKPEERGPDSFVCDFCGKTVERVRRIALDRDYDRLQKAHTVRYACDTCSEEKERERLGRG
jgi:ribosomal protein L37AE/L43A